MRQVAGVSVPFPGILFLNLLISIGWKLRQVAGVSVPFPGILFLNVLNSEQVFNQRFWSFRPLPRDLISQLGYKSANDFIKLGFRPLPGDLISQSDLDYEVAKYEDVFPSPSRGSYFSIGS